MAQRIQVRRDTAANWTSNDPVLASGEIGYDTTNGEIRTGDGSTVWTGLPIITHTHANKAVLDAITASFTTADETKLDGIETGATADQTGAQIKTAYEGEADTNAFTDADHSKLDGIEAGADVTDATNVAAAGAVMDTGNETVNGIKTFGSFPVTPSSAPGTDYQAANKKYVDDSVTGLFDDKGNYNASTNSPDLDTAPGGILKGDVYTVSVSGTFFTEELAIGTVIRALQDDPTTLAHWARTSNNLVASEIKTLYESNSDTNEFSDAEQSKLSGIEASATADQTGAQIKTAYEAEADTNAFTDADHSKLDGIEANATADQTNAEIRTAVDAATDSNVFTDADHTKLNGVETGATTDQTGAQIKVAYEGEADTNAFTDADHSKLDGIEAAADVTDATNVNAAGAVMNSDSTTAAMSFVKDEDNMVSNSATHLASQQSIKAYVDTQITAEKSYQGGYNAATNSPDLDTTPIAGILKGDVYDVTVAGTFFTIAVEIGDTIRSSKDSPTVEGDWVIVQGNLTAASIKTQYESNADTNEFSDAEQTKLAGIESGATADQTGAQIKTAYEAEADTNVFTDADHSKLDGIEASATADQTGAQIKTAYEAEADTNAFTDTEQTKLSGIATSATANDTDANLKARSNHTGTQLASTISDFNTAADGRITAANASDLTDVDATTKAVLKNNLNASVAPTTTDDSGSGYAVGSEWIDTTADKAYICLDATSSAAVWTETTVTNSGSAVTVEDEGTPLTTDVTKINFAGAGVTVTEPATDEMLVTIAGGGGGATDLAVVQARRTTIYTCTGSFVSLTLDTTDFENDAAVVKHNDTTTSRIDILEDGVYELFYDITIHGDASSRTTQTRIYKNGTTLVTGSDMSVLSDGGSNSDNPVSMDRKVIASLVNGDYIEVQITDTSTVEVNAGASLIVTKLEGIQGAVGAAGADGDITWEGNWVSQQYTTNQAVKYTDGNSYVCKLNTVSSEVPTNATYWDILAEKGDTGATGAAGSFIDTLPIFTHQSDRKSEIGSTYVAVAHYPFRGTTKGNPLEIWANTYISAGSTTGKCRIYDATNSLVICEVTGLSTTSSVPIDLGTLSNLSNGAADWEIQIAGDGTFETFIAGISVEY